MRRFLPLPLLLAALAGCSASASPKSTPVPTGRAITRVETVPPSSPVSTSRVKRKTGRTHTLKALPTVKPIYNYPTPTPFPPSAFTAVIRGTVTDEKSHSPIAGALITVGQHPRHLTRSNAFGDYRITFPVGPDVSVQVTAQGFAGNIAIGHLRKGEAIKLNFRLVPITGSSPAAPSPPMVFGSH